LGRQTEHTAQAPQQATSTGTADVKTITIGKSSSAFLIGVETTNARVTFDGTTPDSSHGVVYLKDQAPIYVPCGEGTVIKFTATASANSVVSVVPLA